jgi:hypothetical protein
MRSERNLLKLPAGLRAVHRYNLHYKLLIQQCMQCIMRWYEWLCKLPRSMQQSFIP